MSNDRSREGLIRFLDYMGEKGLVNSTTATTRKAAAQKILSILSEEEASNVLVLDLEDVMTRFHNLEGQNYSPGSLAAYQSRLRTAFEDFAKYIENPLGFKPSGQGKLKGPKANGKPSKASGGDAPVQKLPVSSSTEAGFPNSTILPIPLRPDLIVRIQGLPFDLTPGEAAKLAAVIKAMAISE